MFKTILFIFIFFIYTHIFTIYVLFKEENNIYYIKRKIITLDKYIVMGYYIDK